MKKVYSEYFQKSKVFLYPLLNIKKGIRYVPAETYICWKGIHQLEDLKFICLYAAEDTDHYRLFEQKYLSSHKLFEEYYDLGKNLHLYIYDYSKFRDDLEMFKLGKYSKFSNKTKTLISKFFGDIGTISEYIQSYINPKGFHDLYASHLGVSTDTIEKVYELCSKPDLDKECLQIELPELNLFKNNSVSLESNK